MRSLGRAALVTGTALALVALGLPLGSPVAYAADGPVLSSVWIETSTGPTTEVNEAQSFLVKGTFTDPDATDSHYVLIRLGSTFVETTTSIPFGARSFSVSKLYTDDNPTGTAQDSFTISVTVMDSDGLSSDTRSVAVKVRNVAPTVSNLVLTPSAILDHETVQASGTFTDPSSRDTFTLTLDWGDGSAPYARSYGISDVKTFAAAHEYPLAGPYAVTASVTDDDTGTGKLERPLSVASRNRPPSDLVLAGESVVEGDPATLSGRFLDPDAGDTHSVVIQWGDGGQSDLSLAAGLREFSATHTYTSFGTYTITATVADPAAATTTGTLTLVVSRRNDAPANLVLSTSGAVEGVAGSLDVTFTDADPLDWHWASVTWGDGTAASYVVLDAGGLTLWASHVYAEAGTYTVAVVVADPSGASVAGTVSFEVREPSAEELASELAALVDSWSAEDQNGIAAKLWQAQVYTERGSGNLCNTLAALANHVTAQTDKKLSTDQAGAFWSIVADLNDTMDCAQLQNAELKAADGKPGHGAGDNDSATKDKGPKKK